jgi:hypothetical protein
MIMNALLRATSVDNHELTTTDDLIIIISHVSCCARPLYGNEYPTHLHVARFFYVISTHHAKFQETIIRFQVNSGLTYLTFEQLASAVVITCQLVRA